MHSGRIYLFFVWFFYLIVRQRICYSHWANGARNEVISIGQWGVFNHEKPINLDLSNLHYGPHYKPHYRSQGCVIRENNITTPL